MKPRHAHNREQSKPLWIKRCCQTLPGVFSGPFAVQGRAMLLSSCLVLQPCHEQYAEHTATWNKRRAGFSAAHAGTGTGAVSSPGDARQGGTVNFSLD